MSNADDTLTKCERHVQKNLIDGSQFVPSCKRDGTYEDVQCDGSSAECWCVDRDGKELPQTRSKDLVKCPDQSKLSKCKQSISIRSSFKFLIPLGGLMRDTVRMSEDEDNNILKLRHNNISQDHATMTNTVRVRTTPTHKMN